jgi:hypothetical protein
LTIVAGVAIVIGALATVALMGMYFLYKTNSGTSGKNLFGYRWDDQCYYATAFLPDTSIIYKEVQCNPLCPGFTGKRLNFDDFEIDDFRIGQVLWRLCWLF